MYWWKNGVQMDHSYITDGAGARNTLPITVGYSDNKAVYRCQVSSRVLPQPLTAQVQFTVFCEYNQTLLSLHGMGISFDLFCLHENTHALNFPLEGPQQLSTGKGHFYQENVNLCCNLCKSTAAKAQGTQQ